MKLSNVIKIGTALLVAVAVLAVSIVNLWKKFTTDSTIISNETSISIILFVLGVILIYVIAKFETQEKKLQVLSSSFSRPSTTEVMESRDDFFNRLLEVTLSGKEVFTHMLQDPPKILGEKAEEYFNKVHYELKRKGNDLTCFRRIASLGSKNKALWVLRTLEELKEVDSYSLGTIDINHDTPLTAVHTCFGTNGENVLVWTSMSPDGTGSAFLVRDKHVAKAMRKEHEREFQSCLQLKVGRQLRWENIEKVAKDYELKETEEYIKLIQFKSA